MFMQSCLCFLLCYLCLFFLSSLISIFFICLFIFYTFFLLWSFVVYFRFVLFFFLLCFFFFKQKPAYELRISDWSSDVCSSDLSEAISSRSSLSSFLP